MAKVAPQTQATLALRNRGGSLLWLELIFYQRFNSRLESLPGKAKEVCMSDVEDGYERRKIAVIDDHILFLKGFAMVISDMDAGFDVHSHSTSWQVLEEIQAGERYDLVVCDLIMREMNALAFLRALKQFKVPPPVIVVSAVRDESTIAEIMALGAKAFLHKSSDPDTLEATIRDVLRDATTDAEAGRFQSPVALRKPLLMEGGIEPTRRQSEILILMADGATNQDVAEALKISPNTVKTHMKNIYTMLNVSNRTECLKKSRLLGLV